MTVESRKLLESLVFRNVAPSVDLWVDGYIDSCGKFVEVKEGESRSSRAPRLAAAWQPGRAGLG